MKINIEQFLALSLAIGTAGAVGVAVYSSLPDADPVVADATEMVAEEEPVTEQIAAAVMPSPVAAQPVDRDEAAGIPPVVPEPESNGAYAPGPDTESGNW